MWIKTSERLPKEHTTVLVSGGVAQFIGGVWYTGMEEPLFRRRIMWPVEYWMPFPFLPNSADSGAGEHISQHSNGAEPQEEICPTCKGGGKAPSWGGKGYVNCSKCGGTGKLRHC